MITKNIRFIVVSATILNELTDLSGWGNHHYQHNMIVPPNYLSHGDMLDMDIIKEWYSVKNIESAAKWINEDITTNYSTDYRVHFIRTTEKDVQSIEIACQMNNIQLTKKIKNYI